MVRWMHKCRTDVGFNAKKKNALPKHVFSKKRKDNEIHVAFVNHADMMEKKLGTSLEYLLNFILLARSNNEF